MLKCPVFWNDFRLHKGVTPVLYQKLSQMHFGTQNQHLGVLRLSFLTNSTFRNEKTIFLTRTCIQIKRNTFTSRSKVSKKKKTKKTFNKKKMLRIKSMWSMETFTVHICLVKLSGNPRWPPNCITYTVPNTLACAG